MKEDSAELLPYQGNLAALLELVASIRDNVFLDERSTAELLDMQPDGTHAKQLACALAIHGLIRSEDCEIALIDHGLRGE